MGYLLIFGLPLLIIYGQTPTMSNRLGGTLKALARDAATVLGAVIAVSFISTQAMAGPDIGKPMSVETETITTQKTTVATSSTVGSIDAALEAAASQIAGVVAPITKPVAAAFQPQPTMSKISATGSERDREINCLAQAVYYEARGEPDRGKLAVAEVIVNRVNNRAYPKTYCGVVRQRRGNVCQFSWVCTRNAPPAGPQWNRSQEIAQRVYDGWKPGVVGNATYFHASRVRPSWAGVFPKVAQIGSHIFYSGN